MRKRKRALCVKIEWVQLIVGVRFTAGLLDAVKLPVLVFPPISPRSPGVSSRFLKKEGQMKYGIRIMKILVLPPEPPPN